MYVISISTPQTRNRVPWLHRAVCPLDRDFNVLSHGVPESFGFLRTMRELSPYCVRGIATIPRYEVQHVKAAFLRLPCERPAIKSKSDDHERRKFCSVIFLSAAGKKELVARWNCILAAVHRRKENAKDILKLFICKSMYVHRKPSRGYLESLLKLESDMRRNVLLYKFQSSFRELFQIAEFRFGETGGKEIYCAAFICYHRRNYCIFPHLHNWIHWDFTIISR